MMESETLQVLYDYSYEYKEKKISIVHDEKLKLLQRTNQHWWKVVRPNQNRPFFVPAQYVQTISSPLSEKGQHPPSSGGELSSEGEECSISSVAPSHSHLNQATTSSFVPPSNDYPPSNIPVNNNFKIQHSPSLRVSSSASRHNADPNSSPLSNSMSMKMKRTDSSRASKRALKVKNWSASLEELSKQIVFPGLGAESVLNLSEGVVTNTNNKSSELAKKEEIDYKNNTTTFCSNNANTNTSPSPSISKPVPLPRRTVNELQQESAAVSSPKPIPKARSKNQICDNSSMSSNSKSSGGSSEEILSSCEELDSNELVQHAKNSKYFSRKDQYNYKELSNQKVGADTIIDGDMKPKQSTILTIPSSQPCTINNNSDRNKSISTDSINSTSGQPNTGTLTSATKPSKPSQNEKPLRLLLDNWAEFCTPEGRHYYFNHVSGATSWKPPRVNSLKVENLASTSTFNIPTSFAHRQSQIHNKSSVNSTSTRVIVTAGEHNNNFDHIKSSSTSSEESQPHRTATSKGINSAEASLSNSSHSHRYFEKKPVILTEEEDDDEVIHRQNGNQPSQSQQQLPVPDGWSCSVDTSGQICYINDITGARWFSSQDPQGKIYYYEENSAKSSWFLPVPGISVNDDGSSSSPLSKSTTSDSLEGRESTPPKSSSGNIPMPDVVNSLTGAVKKRYSTGDSDRFLKSRSLIILEPRKGFEPGKISSLPRSVPKSIWNALSFNESEDEELMPIVVIKEGLLSRTRITENGKKVRKNWSTSYVVLTEKHLSLFKDHKSFANMTSRKSDMEIELAGSNLSWAQDKSSRKNVFQLNTSSDFQILFQTDDKEVATEWFEKIAEIIDGQQSDYTLRLRSTSPDPFLDIPVGEKKNSNSRLGRAKSTKVKITGSVENLTSEERSKIKAQLKKFFNRRPPRESLVKKGIYKDEAVFGCHLEKLCSREDTTVPRFVQECIRAIESKEENLKTDGIYRASGNLSQVQKLRLQVDQNNLTCLYQEEDVHVLAGSLKLFFREMKEPLIPSDLFDRALATSSLTNKKEKVNKFRDIVAQLAKPNRATLCYLLKHLLKVSELAEYNRMQIPNLAIVFGPTLMWPAQESTNMALDLMRQNIVIEALLQDYEAVFEKK